MGIDIQEEAYLQRDINWLRFNHRVLQEAKDLRNPLFERIKFLAIFSSNLDEFFKVRVSNLRQIKKIDRHTRKRLHLRPNKTLKQILSEVNEQQIDFGAIFNNQIIPELASNNIFFLSSSQYSNEQIDFINAYFKKEINKLEVLNPATLTPHLEDGVLYFSILTTVNQLYFVKIPTDKRFIPLPNSKDNEFYYTMIDDIVTYQVNLLFKDKEIAEIGEIKLSRDAELYLDEDYEGALAEQIYDALKQRDVGQPTRLLYDASISKEHRKLLRHTLHIGKVDLMPGGKYHNFSDFMSFKNPTSNKELEFEDQPNLDHPTLSKSKDYFKTISEKDQLVHFPYQKFDYVSKLMEQAASDPNVTHIKISLYRIAKTSALNTALLKAVEAGKDVTIFIEAQARFDEANNIKWGKAFSDKGANVIYSIPNIKVHSKIFLIKRLENNISKGYAYISTGNFNENTSKIYVDHGIFTAENKITSEIEKVFDVLERKLIIPKNKHILISPFNTRLQFNTLIDNEIQNARDGKKAKITAKMNSLHDKRMIHKLYEASNAGVEVRLLIRGFCCLVPETKGLSDHIYITSIVDRYLEHGRIYCFENGGNEIMFVGSADWMTRNLDYRIEVLIPIKDTDIYKELKHILNLQLDDNVKARVLDANFTNTYVGNDQSDPKLRSQYEIYDYLKNKL
ncbi:polyphosphate kinase 1 [Neptunitalea lumnitzerae]|uniref:Polyphosphate kinase n=1 Tax=Neptunitalea lumnitzerae TaxID=2965509 RepID=A0ABQ5MJQ4_9FLAO|nr:polyphosphate kinase 1 [Neptunitalea sp. Y10]GLB49567.1 polyphosphate kinase [Neptunitalea sp. Y10]